MIKTMTYDMRTNKEYPSSDLKYVTFFDEDGILRGIQDWIKLRYELTVTNDEGDKVVIELK
ncbi:TPA: hypothetical protein KPF99_003524 [Clostridioides difficile]|uniref:Uncharacterized protein n=1 Tax=Clostridioides difficile TaxID=1496 RepID=A0A9X8RLH5_CLODI|nr:hypothetical protein [Clostridioides difficile]EGT4145720.1 hypothetical protein [Clostridioides difficile]EGT4929454.1 hypothetical protein [Clostridioides difficile]EGT5564447.1 hypothetical protein [Clostridioides difficile]EQH15555.1 hypothetical protein QKW_3917 [Clostridioides difficile DA00210]MBH7922113.1 hypothetical protein [Clostridioides difficile]